MFLLRICHEIPRQDPAARDAAALTPLLLKLADTAWQNNKLNHTANLYGVEEDQLMYVRRSVRRSVGRPFGRSVRWAGVELSSWCRVM
jgi:hypothetical protein